MDGGKVVGCRGEMVGGKLKGLSLRYLEYPASDKLWGGWHTQQV
jgi:hypothetical protein